MEPKYMRVTCPECGWRGNYTLEDLEKTLKKLKMDKAIVVARQMHDKSGPYYDRWVAAMEARGLQKRCGECSSLGRSYHPGPKYYDCFTKGRRERGWYACKLFHPREGGR